MAYGQIGKGEGGKPYGHVAGHTFHDVIVRVEHRDTVSGDRFRLTTTEVWGAAQGAGRDEVHGRKRVSVSNRADLSDAMDALYHKARAVGMDLAYFEAALMAAEYRAEAWLVLSDAA